MIMPHGMGEACAIYYHGCDAGRTAIYAIKIRLEHTKSLIVNKKGCW